MKKIFAGIIALLIPIFLFAQTAKEAQDLNQVRQKVSKLENENSRLKTQVSGVLKTISKMNEAEMKEHLDLAKHDSLSRANQDTVRSYSGRLLKMESNIAEIEHALLLRTQGFIMLLIIILILIAIRWWLHRGMHRKHMDEVMAKMNAQREEREKRIAELKASIEKYEGEILSMKNETGERLSTMTDNIAHIDRNIQVLLNERSAGLEQQIKDGLARLKNDHEEAGKQLLRKIEDVHSLVSSKVNELGQKVVDSGKKLDDQINAAHKKTDELKTVLAREIEAIRSKFE